MATTTKATMRAYIEEQDKLIDALKHQIFVLRGLMAEQETRASIDALLVNRLHETLLSYEAAWAMLVSPMAANNLN